MPSAPIASSQFGLVRAGAVVNLVTGVIGYEAKLPNLLLLTAPLAASVTYYASASPLNGSLAIINKKPDFPRNVRITASGATTANVVITGLDTQGYKITETLTLAGTGTVLGNKAFSEILTAQLPTAGGVTISIGIGVKFGLNFQATAATVFLALVDNVADTNFGTFVAGGTTAGSDYYGTWSPATAPNGTHNYRMYYIPTSLSAYGVNN